MRHRLWRGYEAQTMAGMTILSLLCFWPPGIHVPAFDNFLSPKVDWQTGSLLLGQFVMRAARYEGSSL